MRQLPSPAELRKRRMIGGGIAGVGLTLLGYQLWRLIGFLGSVDESGAAKTLSHPGFSALGTTLVLALLGLVIGVAIGRGRGARKRCPRPDSRRPGVTIEGESKRLNDDG